MMFTVLKDGTLNTLTTSSSEAVVRQLKTMGVKNLDVKKTPKKLTKGRHTFKGVNDCSVVVIAS